eukprot:TRINITY_DN41845_c0_g1_i1.p1 TRINITY_DN41845_c0_g1~~TRINITY_DN41845_c0_g1_i1.p1  ORF type:complete len:330 (-),score=77.46 TRINITY_DN41845_c0_g1_i1:53-925(-)
MSELAKLAVYLPTGTTLAFQAVAEAIIPPNGTCNVVEKVFAAIALGVLGAACVFSAFTDSFTYIDGKTYYVLVRRGPTQNQPFFLLGKPDGYTGDGKMPGDLATALSRIPSLDGHDVLHAILSLIVFLSLTLLSDSVRICFFGTDVPATIVRSVPLGVTTVASAFFSKCMKKPPDGYTGDGKMPGDLATALSRIPSLDGHDVLHAILSLIVFLSLTLLSDSVRICFFGTDVPATIVRSVPLGVTTVASAFFSKCMKKPRKSFGLDFSGGGATSVETQPLVAAHNNEEIKA